MLQLSKVNYCMRDIKALLFLLPCTVNWNQTRRAAKVIHDEKAGAVLKTKSECLWKLGAWSVERLCASRGATSTRARGGEVQLKSKLPDRAVEREEKGSASL